jgi:hypothetical protein
MVPEHTQMFPAFESEEYELSRPKVSWALALARRVKRIAFLHAV